MTGIENRIQPVLNLPSENALMQRTHSKRKQNKHQNII